jgi:hypothetical protein
MCNECTMHVPHVATFQSSTVIGAIPQHPATLTCECTTVRGWVWSFNGQHRFGNCAGGVVRGPLGLVRRPLGLVRGPLGLVRGALGLVRGPLSAVRGAPRAWRCTSCEQDVGGRLPWQIVWSGCHGNSFDSVVQINVAAVTSLFSV